MKKHLTSFARIPFVRDVLTLQTGSVIVLGMQFAFGIFIARYLGPHIIGLYALTLAVISTITVILDAGQNYSFLTLMPEAYAHKSKQEVHGVLRYYIRVSIWWTIPLTLLLIVVSPLIIHFFSRGEDVVLWVELGLFPLLIAPIHDLVSLTLQATRRITALTKTDITYGFLDVFFPLVCVVSSPTLTALMFGRLLSSTMKACVSLFIWRRTLRNDPVLPTLRELKRAPDIKDIGNRSVVKLGIWIAAGRQLSDILSSVPVYLLGAVGTAEDIGRYAKFLSYTSISTFFSGNVSRMISSVLPEVHASGNKKFTEAFWKGNIGNMLATFVILAPLLLLGNTGLTLLFGEKFAVPPIIFLLFFLLSFDGITVGFGTFYRIHNAIPLSIITQLLSFGIAISTWYFVHPFVNPIVSIVIMSTVNGTISKIFHFINFSIIRRWEARSALPA